MRLNTPGDISPRYGAHLLSRTPRQSDFSFRNRDVSAGILSPISRYVPRPPAPS
jgi:hypothetical protein